MRCHDLVNYRKPITKNSKTLLSQILTPFFPQNLQPSPSFLLRTKPTKLSLSSLDQNQSWSLPLSLTPFTSPLTLAARPSRAAGSAAARAAALQARQGQALRARRRARRARRAAVGARASARARCGRAAGGRAGGGRGVFEAESGEVRGSDSFLFEQDWGKTEL